MGRETSVAPKERVNITYRPATGDAAEEVELPLRIMMLGDYTQREDETPLEERKPINVDKENFGEVLTAQRLALDLSVDDELSGEAGRELSVGLTFPGLSDFTPEGVARQVPELRALLELRETLSALKSPLAERPHFRKRLQGLLGSDDGRARLMAELGMGGPSKE